MYFEINCLKMYLKNKNQISKPENVRRFLSMIRVVFIHFFFTFIPRMPKLFPVRMFPVHMFYIAGVYDETPLKNRERE